MCRRLPPAVQSRVPGGAALRKTIWVVLLAFVAAACGDSSTATTGDASPAPTSTATAAPILAGLGFEVHKEPG